MILNTRRSLILATTIVTLVACSQSLLNFRNNKVKSDVRQQTVDRQESAERDSQESAEREIHPDESAIVTLGKTRLSLPSGMTEEKYKVVLTKQASTDSEASVLLFESGNEVVRIEMLDAATGVLLARDRLLKAFEVSQQIEFGDPSQIAMLIAKETELASATIEDLTYVISPELVITEEVSTQSIRASTSIIETQSIISLTTVISPAVGVQRYEVLISSDRRTKLSYNQTRFTESSSNDGSVVNSIIVTLSNGIFQTGPFTEGNQFTLHGDLPEGLTFIATHETETQVKLNLTGNASAHSGANDTSITLGWNTSAFEDGATPATGSSQEFSIDFLNDVTKVAFSYTGSDQTFTVPTGVTLLGMKLWGAAGGSTSGGAGGYAYDEVSVTPGETITIRVGQAGFTPPFGSITTAGTFGGGGGSTTTYPNHSKGGGGSFVFRNGSIAVENLLAAAGGGGGGGLDRGGSGGAGGGVSGQAGWSANSDSDLGLATCSGGNPGTQSAGGPSVEGSGAGAQFQGGSGSNDNFSNGAGGGGGGFFGGGGGGDSADAYCGGGGGSGYVSTSKGVLTSGDGTAPGNSLDPDRESAGTPAAASQPGRVVFMYTLP